MEQQQLRQTAYKVWIADLINSHVEKNPGEFEPNFIKIKNINISRINILATVVLNYKSEDGNYSTITLDDGSAQIQVKAWREDTSLLNLINIGDTLIVIGRVREYNNQVYILPEIIKKLDNPDWIKLRKLELLSIYGSPLIHQSGLDYSNNNPRIQPLTESSRQKILNLIEKNSVDNGADIMNIISLSGIDEQEAESIINELIKEGEVYQPRPGKLKIMS